MPLDPLAIAPPPTPPRSPVRGAGFVRRLLGAALLAGTFALLAGAFSLLAVASATAEEIDAAEESEPPDAPASGYGPPPPPMGARFAEALEGDRIRVGYSFERIRLAGLRTGDDHLTPDQVRAFGFPETPRTLDTTLHTVTLAYAAHPRVTLVLEIPFVQNEYERFDLTTGSRQHQTEGIGDVGFSVIIPFIRKGFESTQVHVGLDVPTGSIRKSAEGRPLPYAAQPGNGSVDLEWGWTYKGELDRFAWGGQVGGRHPVGRNGRDWRGGSRFTGRLWGVVRVLGGLSASVRADWEKQNEIDGFDRDLQPPIDPSEDPELQDGILLAVAPGLSMEVPALAGQRLGVEVGIPVYQDLDGPQLERDWTFKAGWQWTY